MRVGVGSANVDASKAIDVLDAEAVPCSGDSFQEKLLDGSIDAFVAWYDRVPQGLDPGISLTAVMERGPAGMVSFPCPLDEVMDHSAVGVPSELMELVVRRERPDLNVRRMPIGDLVDDMESYACIVLPAAMMEGYPLDPEVYIGAPSQGCVAVFARKGDETVKALRLLDHMPSRTAAEAERGIMNLIGATPDAPLGVRADVEGDAIRIRAVSYCYGADGRRCDEWVPIDYVMDEVLGIAEYLANKRDSVI